MNSQVPIDPDPAIALSLQAKCCGESRDSDVMIRSSASHGWSHHEKGAFPESASETLLLVTPTERRAGILQCFAMSGGVLLVRLTYSVAVC